MKEIDGDQCACENASVDLASGCDEKHGRTTWVAKKDAVVKGRHRQNRPLDAESFRCLS